MLAKCKIALMKFLILKLGFLSGGIDLSLKHGLTSGKTLDYVYRNHPSGHLIIGPFIDHAFLSHPGWQAVRIRRIHLERLLIEAIQESDGSPFILDIASGQASYVLSVLKRNPGCALCQDLDPNWVHEGQMRAHLAGLCHRVRFQQGNAFEIQGFRQDFHPDIVISSGFYDWIEEDALIQKSIAEIAQILPQNGTFILTTQSAHPDQAFVEEIFKDFNHQPLRMKMRSLELISKWLEEAGFQVEKVLQDRAGYYSVIKARKVLCV